MSPHEQFLCALLRGESPPWPGGVDAVAINKLLKGAQYHGLLPLLAVELNRSTRTDVLKWAK